MSLIPLRSASANRSQVSLILDKSLWDELPLMVENGAVHDSPQDAYCGCNQSRTTGLLSCIAGIFKSIRGLAQTH